MLWANYNSFCKKEFDKAGCSSSRLADYSQRQQFIRSPELFHAIIESDRSGHTPLSPLHKPLDSPCQHSSSIFSPFINVPSSNRTVLFVSLERSEASPIEVTHRIGRFLGWDFTRLDLKKMFRIGELSDGASTLSGTLSAGTDGTNWLQIDFFDKYTFPISQNRPLLNSTRQILDNCWHSECLKLSQLTKYPYPSCVSSGSSGKSKNTKKKSTTEKEKEKENFASEASVPKTPAKVKIKPGMKNFPPTFQPSFLPTLTPSLQSTSSSSVAPQPNLTSAWDLQNERGIMKSQTLTISRIYHPSNSLHSCYTIKCTGNQCPSVRHSIFIISPNY